MKTPISHVPVVMILPAALLLSQCAPNGGPLQKVSGTPASSALHRTLVSFRPSGISSNGTRLVSEDEPVPIVTGDLAAKDSDESIVPRLSPVVVTASTFPDDIVEGWPSNVDEAEMKSAWIFLKSQEPSPPHPTEDSVSTWMESLR